MKVGDTVYFLAGFWPIDEFPAVFKCRIVEEIIQYTNGVPTKIVYTIRVNRRLKHGISPVLLFHTKECAQQYFVDTHLISYLKKYLYKSFFYTKDK